MQGMMFQNRFWVHLFCAFDEDDLSILFVANHGVENNAVMTRGHRHLESKTIVSV
jgi:hypothetical protein